jgi:hypothetical protein
MLITGIVNSSAAQVGEGQKPAILFVLVKMVNYTVVLYLFCAGWLQKPAILLVLAKMVHYTVVNYSFVQDGSSW